MFQEIEPLLNQIAQQLNQRQYTVSTAESCTGGLIAAALTERAGSSAFFRYGFVSYANEAKQQLLSVPESTLLQHGAVSAETVVVMAQGAVKHAQADIAISVSGIAGPTGASPNKPVGTVWFGLATPNEVYTQKCHFSGSRSEVRWQATVFALTYLSEYLTRDAG